MIVSSRKESDLQSAVTTLQSENIDASYIAANCGDEGDIQQLADEAIARSGAVDILVNNAGAAWVSVCRLNILLCRVQ